MIFHIATAADWARRTDTYTPSGFAKEGFIHCSTADQLEDVAKTFFSSRDDLVLLTIDAGALGDQVAYEDLYGTGEVFPHIYATLPITAVIEAESYPVP